MWFPCFCPAVPCYNSPMRTLTRTALYLLLIAISACDPFSPVLTPTPITVIVTPSASNTPIPTPTLPPTAVPSATPTAPPTPTATPLACLSSGGQIVPVDDFRSPSIGERLPYRVYLPPCYGESGRRFPTLYLLPGLNEDESQWGALGLAAALDQGLEMSAIAPMLVVMPALGAIGAEAAFPPDDSYETYIMDELRPAIERDFCTIENRDHRAIGGISRGGFWAYSIAMRHADVFGAVGGHAAAFDEGNAPAANNPLELALDAPFLQNADLRMYLDNGANDPAGVDLGVFSGRLSARGIEHTYVITPGAGHDDAYWSSQVDEYLTFYSREWPRGLDALPSCFEASP